MSTELLVGKLKVFVLSSAAAVSCAAVPTSIAISATPENSEKSITQIKEGWTKLKTFVEETVQPLKSEFEKFASEHLSTSTLTSNKEAILEQYRAISTAKDTASKLITKENVESVNYYLFEFGKLIKTFFKYMPRIMLDSLSEDPERPLEGNKLSMQKLGALMEQNNSSKLTEALNWVVENKMDRISDLKDHEANLIMDLIGTIPYDHIDNWLKNIETNLTAIKGKSDSDFCNSGKFFMDLLIGDNNISQIGEKATQLETSVNSLETKLKTMLKEKGEEIITALKAALTKLKTFDKSQIPDMCELGKPKTKPKKAS